MFVGTCVKNVLQLFFKSTKQMHVQCIYICTYIYIPSGPQVSARGGVGWGMLTSSSWYVDGWGGVGHVNVMFMVR